MTVTGDYTKIYDIESKIQAIFTDDKVISVHRFTECPYVWFGKYKEEIESGKVKWVGWSYGRENKCLV